MHEDWEALELHDSVIESVTLAAGARVVITFSHLPYQSADDEQRAARARLTLHAATALEVRPCHWSAADHVSDGVLSDSTGLRGTIPGSAGDLQGVRALSLLLAGGCHVRVACTGASLEIERTESLGRG